MNLKNISIALIFLAVIGLALTGMFRKPAVPEGADSEEVNGSNPIEVVPADVFASKPDANAPGAVRAFAPILDEQGAVTVKATPLNLENPSETLDFEIVLNTHSVDLSMDLAMLASLTTDTGITIQAVNWEAPLGGHHVSGTLSFPAEADGNAVLDGATTFTVSIVNVDAPERVFTWGR